MKTVLISLLSMGTIAMAQITTPLPTITPGPLPGQSLPDQQVPTQPTQPMQPVPPTPQARQTAPSMATDRDLNFRNTNLSDRIRRDLTQDNATAGVSSGVTVHSNNGQVILRGQVPSVEAERSLMDRVRRTSGVSNVTSELTILNQTR